VADLVEEEKWEPGVYQLEETDPVVGGENGVDNLQAKQLGNRTQYLLGKLKQAISATLPVKVTGNVHDGFSISINSASSSAAGVVKLSDSISSTSSSTAASSAAVKKAYDNSSGLVGNVITWLLDSPPDKYIELNGATLSRTAYSELFAVIGTKYGAGDGVTTFKVPDFRGVFLRGWDNGRGVDSGRSLGSYQSDAIRDIVGSFRLSQLSNALQYNDPQGAISFEDASGTNRSGDNSGKNYISQNITFRASNVVPTASDNRPSNYSVMFCVRYKV